MLEEMKAFVLVGEEGSIQAAAAKSYRTQSAVSRQVQRLEEVLGTKLLDRRTKPPRLTPDGEMALERCRSIISDVQDLAASFGGLQPSGLLRIGIANGAHSAGLVQRLGEARTRFPALQLRIYAGWSADLDRRVRDGSLDLAVSMRVSRRQSGEASPYDLVVVGPMDQRSLRPGVETTDRPPWVLSPDPCEVRSWLSQTFTSHGWRFEVAAEAQDPSLQLMLIEQGAGYGLLPRGVLDRNPERQVIIHEWAALDSRLQFDLVRSPNLFRMDPVVDLLQSALIA